MNLHKIDKSSCIFSKSSEPVATAKPGDLLSFTTYDCFGGQIQKENELVHEIDFSKANPATGPVYIEGAEVGDVLAVDILDIKVADQGIACTIGDLGPLAAGGDYDTKTRTFEIKDGATTYNGVSWLLKPMIGVIGTAPSDVESVPTGHAGNHGGNMDSRIITKGVRVYFPVRVEGALLQLGDLHASMGDGELSGTGIEVAGEVLVRTELIKNFELNWPVTETEDMIYVNTRSINQELAPAIEYATEEMYRLMKPIYGWDKPDTAIYFSLRGNIEINQSTFSASFAPSPDEEQVGMTVRFGIPKVPGKESLIK